MSPDCEAFISSFLCFLFPVILTRSFRDYVDHSKFVKRNGGVRKLQRIYLDHMTCLVPEHRCSYKFCLVVQFHRRDWVLNFDQANNISRGVWSLHSLVISVLIILYICWLARGPSAAFSWGYHSCQCLLLGKDHEAGQLEFSFLVTAHHKPSQRKHKSLKPWASHDGFIISKRFCNTFSLLALCF